MISLNRKYLKILVAKFYHKEEEGEQEEEEEETANTIFQKEDPESEEDNKLEVDEVAKTLPQGTNHTPDALAAALSGMSDR